MSGSGGRTLTWKTSMVKKLENVRYFIKRFMFYRCRWRTDVPSSIWFHQYQNATTGSPVNSPRSYQVPTQSTPVVRSTLRGLRPDEPQSRNKSGIVLSLLCTLYSTTSYTTQNKDFLLTKSKLFNANFCTD
jgi:hypothetical protein